MTGIGPSKVTLDAVCFRHSWPLLMPKMRDGGDFLAALVIGYEIGTRAGMALHRSVSDYHTSGAWVALACAGIGARILKLDKARTCPSPFRISNWLRHHFLTFRN